MAIRIQRRVQEQPLPNYRQRVDTDTGLEALGEGIKQLGAGAESVGKAVAAADTQKRKKQNERQRRAKNEASLKAEQALIEWQNQLKSQVGVDDDTGDLRAKAWLQENEGKFDGSLDELAEISGLHPEDLTEIRLRASNTWARATNQHILGEDERAFVGENQALLELANTSGKQAAELAQPEQRNDQLKHSRALTVQAIEAAADRYGWDEGQVEAKKMAALTRYHSGVVKSLAGMDKQHHAKAWLEDYTSEIDPTVRRELHDSIKAADARDFGLRESMRLIDKHTSAPVAPVRPDEELDLEDLSPARRAKAEGDYRREVAEHERAVANYDQYDFPLEEMAAELRDDLRAGKITPKQYDATMGRLGQAHAQKERERAANDSPKLDVVKQEQLNMGRKWRLDRSSPNYTEASRRAQNTMIGWHDAHVRSLRDPARQTKIDTIAVDRYLSLPTSTQLEIDVGRVFRNSNLGTRTRLERIQRNIKNDTGAGRADVRAIAEAEADRKGFIGGPSTDEGKARRKFVGRIGKLYHEWAEKHPGERPPRDEVARWKAHVQRELRTEGIIFDNTKEAWEVESDDIVVYDPAWETVDEETDPVAAVSAPDVKDPTVVIDRDTGEVTITDAGPTPFDRAGAIASYRKRHGRDPSEHELQQAEKRHNALQR